MASYTDQQPTRVYRREGDAAEAPRSSIGNTQPMARKEGLFEGISLSQIIAGAAAAATSMVLASHLGWAGSVIGAAVSSVVTVVSSQVYRKFLQASAEKLKSGRDALGGALEEVRAGGAGERAGSYGAGAYDDRTTMQMPAAASARGARIAPAKLKARAAQERAAERAATQRKVVIFSVIIAIAAVAICAAAILAGTAGEGLGTKAQPLLAAPETVIEPADDAPDDALGGAPRADGAPQTDSGANDAAATPSGTSDTGSATGSGNGTSQNQGASTGGTASSDAGSTDSAGGSGDTSSSDAGSATGSDSGTDTSTGNGAAAGDASGSANAA